MSAYLDFARRFFETLDQPGVERDGRLHVSLKGELAAFFGVERLVLTDRPHDREGELVAFGSEMFERMLGFLETRGRFAAGRLAVSGRPAPSLALLNGRVVEHPAVEADRWRFVFNYHLSFVSDERTERLFSVCLDEHGLAAPDPAFDSDALEPIAEPGPAPAAIVGAAEAAVLAEGERLADALESEGAARLARVAERLTRFYEAQIEELPLRRRKGMSEDEAYDALLEARQMLRRELERKLAEEQGRHRLRVQLRLVSRAQIAVPGRERVFHLATAFTERWLAAWENTHTRTLALPPCERCGTVPGELGATVALCADGHVICPACLACCGACGRDACKSELSTCAECQGASCPSCLGHCAEGHVVCRTHLAGCACCGQAYCGGCLAGCPDCPSGARLARAHGTPCVACQKPVCGAHRSPCALCGGVACGLHREECAGCGQGVCAAHMAECRHCELPYCARCRDAELPGESGDACRACGVVGDGIEAPAAWLAPLEGVPQAARYGRYTGIENERYRYLLGRGLLGDLLVITTFEGLVVKVKEIGLWGKLFGWAR